METAVLQRRSVRRFNCDPGASQRHQTGSVPDTSAELLSLSDGETLLNS